MGLTSTLINKLRPPFPIANGHNLDQPKAGHTKGTALDIGGSTQQPTSLNGTHCCS